MNFYILFIDFLRFGQIKIKIYQKNIENWINIWFSLCWYIWIIFLKLVTRCRKTHPVWRTTYLEYSHKEVNLSWYQIIRITFFLILVATRRKIYNPYSFSTLSTSFVGAQILGQYIYTFWKMYTYSHIKVNMHYINST